jgi:hypothetical protein
MISGVRRTAKNGTENARIKNGEMRIEEEPFRLPPGEGNPSDSILDSLFSILG